MISKEVQIKSIYIHLPFCKERCHYCDFYSTRISETYSLIKPYMEAIKNELIKYHSMIAKTNTLYIGGGTPSTIPPSNLVDLLNFLNKKLSFASNYEFTIEANPESITKDFIDIISDSGLINRISLGIQSLDDILLQRLGRVHNRERALKAIETIYSKGFTNISVDFLIGITDNTDDLLKQMESLINNYPITHISTYILMTDKKREKLKEFLNIDEDIIIDQYIKLHHFLKKNGFIHYEVSNYAKPNYESRHNINYWQNGLYLGLGASAAGYFMNEKGERIRYKNTSDIKKYISGVNEKRDIYEEYEYIDRKKYINENIMLSLRTRDGIDLHSIKGDMTEQEFDYFIKKTENLKKEGYIQVSNERITPTLKGFIFNNYIIRELFL